MKNIEIQVFKIIIVPKKKKILSDVYSTLLIRMLSFTHSGVKLYASFKFSPYIKEKYTKQNHTVHCKI